MSARPEKSDAHELMCEALDLLRVALDHSLATEDEAASGLIIWAIRDLDDTINLIAEINQKQLPAHDANEPLASNVVSFVNFVA